MYIICGHCGLIVGCSQDNGSTAGFCEMCHFIEKCSINIKELEDLKITTMFLIATWNNKCQGHNLKGGKNEN